MKNILIPSDFSVQSLACIKHLPAQFSDDRISILLVHVFLLTDSINDLMLLSRRNKDYDHISPAFRNRCMELEREYRERIHSIRVECFYGCTAAVFRNYLEGHRIDRIVYPQHYQFRKLGKESVDPARLIANCGWAVQVLDQEIWAVEEAPPFSREKDWSYSLSLKQG